MTAFRVARIYDYQPQSGETAIFLDRLYPRGVHKELMAQIVWLKDLTPNRYDAFAARYRQELQDPEHQAALAELWRLAKEQPRTVLLTAVKQPERSHIAVLLDYLHAD